MLKFGRTCQEKSKLCLKLFTFRNPRGNNNERRVFLKLNESVHSHTETNNYSLATFR